MANQAPHFFERIIVKVQLPIAGNGHLDDVMVYNENKTIMMITPAPRGMRRRMRGELKAYFYAHVEKGWVVIDEKAPWQDW